jgi:hypothetical protein
VRAALVLLMMMPSTALAQATPTPAPAVDPVALSRALAAFEDEPSAADVVGWALAASTLDPAAASDAIDRARFSALLPQLRVGVRRGLGWDWANRQTTTTDTSSLASGEDLSLIGTLIFRFDRLLAPSEETGLMRERRALEESRTTLAAQVIALYFERRRLQVEDRLTGATDLERAMRIAELSAMLDVLTRGRFGEALE